MSIIHSPTAIQLSEAIADTAMAHRTPFVLATPNAFIEVRTQFDGVLFWAEYADFKRGAVNFLDKPLPAHIHHHIFLTWGIDTQSHSWEITPGGHLFHSGGTNVSASPTKPEERDEPEIVVPNYEGVSCVYFVQAKKMGLIKIGYSTNVQKRLGALSTGCPDALELLCVVKGDQKLESKVHQKFAEDRVKGEWFNPSPGLLAFIKTIGE